LTQAIITALSLSQANAFEGTLSGMIRDMDIIAQIVLLILLFLSVVSWAITFHKIAVFRRARAETEKFLSLFRRRRSVSEFRLSGISFKRTPLSRMFEAGLKEMEELETRSNNPRRRKESSLFEEDAELSKKDRLDVIRMTLERVGSEEINRLEKSIVFLATTGNVSPFFGLLGTVWGIMHSFASIGVRGSASLAVVAPGIAEALIATIMGLAVAIPAVMAYNFFNNKLKVISTQVDNFALEFIAAVKKEELQK
jgi:biopolymer transport protein TolQ